MRSLQGSYRLRNQPLSFFVVYLAKCEPVYKTFPGWSSSAIDIPKGIIPDEMENFLDFISESLSIPISIVSLGPGREETIIP